VRGREPSVFSSAVMAFCASPERSQLNPAIRATGAVPATSGPTLWSRLAATDI